MEILTIYMWRFVKLLNLLLANMCCFLPTSFVSLISGQSYPIHYEYPDLPDSL